MFSPKRLYLLVVATVSAWLLTASAAFAVGTSQISLAAVVDDVIATLDANVLLVLAVLSITIGVPLAIRFIRRIIR